MDPTPEQLRSLDTLEQLLDFAGLDQPLRVTTLEALGHPTTVREISFVSQGDLEDALTTFRVPRPVAEGGGPSGPSVQASPVQKGVVRFLLRVARLRAGLPVEGLSPQTVSGSIPSVGGLIQPTKRVKLSSLVDSTAEAELVTLEGSEIRRLSGEYKRARGELSPQGHGAVGGTALGGGPAPENGSGPVRRLRSLRPSRQEGIQEVHTGVIHLPGGDRHLEEGGAPGPPPISTRGGRPGWS